MLPQVGFIDVDGSVALVILLVGSGDELMTSEQGTVNGLVMAESWFPITDVLLCMWGSGRRKTTKLHRFLNFQSF
jgi:hypothetical protein